MTCISQPQRSVKSEIIHRIEEVALIVVLAFQALWGLADEPPASVQFITNATPAANPAASAPTEKEVKGVVSRPKEDFRAKAVTNAAPEAESVAQSSNVEKGFFWTFACERWNGLRMELSRKTRLKSPRELLRLQARTNAASMDLEQLKMSATVGGVLEFDGAAYRTDGNLDLRDDLQARRVRIKVQGDCILIYPVGYKIEIGYVPHKFTINNAWISSDHINYLGYMVIGIYQPPMGLDLQTSSRDLSFMEPASVLQALAPANEAGIQIGQPVFNQRATWTLGIFAGGLTATEYGNASQDFGNLIGRFTYLAVDHLAPSDHPEENELLHLGLSANVQYSASSTVRYRSRPESYLADHLIDTGNIDAAASGELGFEAAYVKGPFSVQGEFLDSFVRRNSSSDLNFYGFYASASWFLTGESRPYDRVNGDFKRLVPIRNFDFGRGGHWGAFEVATRFSYTDLDDAEVRGGRMGILMGEVNWYLHSHVRWRFNVGRGRVSGGVHDGNILLFQTRVGVDF